MGSIVARCAALLLTLATAGCGERQLPPRNSAMICRPDYLVFIATPENGSIDSREEDAYQCMGVRALQVPSSSMHLNQDAVAIVNACDGGFRELARRDELLGERANHPGMGALTLQSDREVAAVFVQNFLIQTRDCASRNSR
jgi:hypothetical protein